MIYNTIVFSGGSLKGVAFLGSLQYLIDNSFVERDKLINLVGVSIGSILAYLYCIGYEPIDILLYIKRTHGNLMN